MEQRLSQTPRWFTRRIWIYSKEMFPVLIYLPYVVALYACMSFIVQALSGQEIVIDQAFYVGIISAFFMMLQMRTFDDLKDIDLDIELFPHRATAQKLVLKSDIVAISTLSFLIVLNVNIFWAQATLPVYALMISYCLLTYKWFFAEQYHRKHIFVTMLDHQPIPYAINFFLIHTALLSGVIYEDFQLKHFLLLMMISLPVTAWEISRKVRSKDMETAYETFSMVIGMRLASILPMLFLLAASGISIYLGQLLSLGFYFYLVDFMIIAYILFYYLRFIFIPKKEYNTLTNNALVSTTLIFFNLLIHVLIRFEIQF